MSAEDPMRWTQDPMHADERMRRYGKVRRMELSAGDKKMVRTVYMAIALFLVTFWGSLAWWLT